MNFRGSVAVVAASLALVACGGGDDSPSSDGGSKGGDSAFTEQLAAGLKANGDGTFVDDDQAMCAAESIVGALGQDRLLELGLDGGDLQELGSYGFTPEEFDKVVDSVFNCVDIKSSLKEQLATQFTEEQSSCIVDKIDMDMLRDLAKSELGNGSDTAPDEFQNAMMQAVSDCGAG